MPFTSIYREIEKTAGLISLSKRPWTVIVAVAIGLCLTAFASAEPSETPPIAYYASSECPTRNEFMVEVDERAEGAMGPTNPDLPPYVVEVGQNDQGAFAIFQYQDASGSRVDRSFKAESCKEVASAVALVVALALQGGKVREPEPDALQQQEQESGETNDAQQQGIDRTKEPTDNALDKEVGSVDWQFGASVLVDSLTIPELLIKAGVFGGITWNENGSGIQASFVFGNSGIVERSGRSASFLLLAGRIDVCPLHILRISNFVVHPCLAVEMGSVRSSGEQTEGFRSETHEKFWSAGGPLLRIRAAIYDLFLEVNGGAWFPLIRGTDKYVFDAIESERSFYVIPDIGGTLGVNVGYRF